MRTNVKQILCNKKLISIIISITVIVLRYIVGNIYYTMNDDYAMDYISQGKYGNGYDEHLVFINIIIGKVIKGLYSISDSINWYAIFHLAVVAVSFALLIYIFWSKCKSVLVIPSVVLVELLVLHNFTFTVIAYMCIFTAMLYLVYAADKRELSLLDGIVTILFLITGVMIRSNTLLTSLILTVPLIVYGILNSKNKKNVILILCSCIICTFCVNCYDNYSYNKEPLWKEYREYNAALRVIDYPMERIKNDTGLLKRNDFTQHDIECFRNWMFADKEVFAKDKITDLYEGSTLSDKYNFNVLDIIKQMLKIKRNYILLAWGILCIILIKKKGIPYAAGALVVMYAMIAALIFRNRLVIRVMIPIYLIGFCTSLFFTSIYMSKDRIKKVLLLLLCLSLGVSVVILGEDYKNGIEGNVNKEKYSKVRNYIQNNEEILYLTSPILLDILTCYSPILEKGDDMNQENIMALGGWSIYSGKYYAQMKHNHIEQPERLVLSLLNNKNVQYIAATNEDSYARLVIEYLEEHTGKKVNRTIIKTFSDEEMVVYQLSTE